MSKKQIGIVAFFEHHNKDFSKLVGYRRSQTTYARYRIVCKHLSTYIKATYKKEDVPLADIRTSFLNGFDAWLRKECRLAPNSVWVYMISFKRILAMARTEGLTGGNPFAAYVNRYTRVSRGYLLEDELLRLMDVPVSTPMEERVRDLFLFAAFTGLSYIDIKNLREENVQKFFDGNWWIITHRQKTRVESNVRLLAVPLRIIDKYRGEASDGRLFSVPSNNCCNKNLQRLAVRCGIRIHLTFHVGRHTFATLALNRGVPIETLSRILGHTNISTTQIYAKITNQKISADLAMLSENLSTVEKALCRKL